MLRAVQQRHHTGEGTIRDNDDDGGGRTPELSIGDAAVQEGGTAQFEVTLRPASEQTVTVNFETAEALLHRSG